MFCLHVSASPVVLIQVMVDPTESDSGSLFDGFQAAVSQSVGIAPSVSESTHPWLETTNVVSPSDTGTGVGMRSKEKGSYLRRCYTEDQLAVAYRYLTDATSISSPLAGLLFGSYGGRVN